MSAFVLITYFTKTKCREVALQIVPLFETKLFPFPFHLVGNKARGSLLSDKWPQTAPSEGTVVCVCPLIFLLTRAFCVPQEASSTEYVCPCCGVVAAAWTRRDEVLFASQGCISSLPSPSASCITRREC